MAPPTTWPISKSWSPALRRPATRHTRYASASVNTGAAPSGRSTGRSVNAGSVSAKPRPKWPIMSVWLSSRMLSVNVAPSLSHAHTSRSRLRATLICGGSNEHCCTQLASMPVSASPCRTVNTNRPLGMRPRAAIIRLRSSPSLMPPSLAPSSLLHQVRDRLVNFVVIDGAVRLSGPLAGDAAFAVEDVHARHAVDAELLRPELRLLVEVDIRQL